MKELRVIMTTCPITKNNCVTTHSQIFFNGCEIMANKDRASGVGYNKDAASRVGALKKNRDELAKNLNKFPEDSADRAIYIIDKLMPIVARCSSFYGIEEECRKGLICNCFRRFDDRDAEVIEFGVVWCGEFNRE